MQGIRVIAFNHMVMGPTVGVILPDLGAEVIKLEPVGGDNTCRLRGSGDLNSPKWVRSCTVFR